MSILDQDWQQAEEEESDEALSLDHSARVAVVDITQRDHVRTLDIGHCEWILKADCENYLHSSSCPPSPAASVRGRNPC